MEEKVAKLLEKNIHEWVKNNFGQSEADDPSWNIEELAKNLAHSLLIYDIHRMVERYYLGMDCDYIAYRNGIKLTEKERELAISEFMECEPYVDIHAEDWVFVIDKIKGEGEQEQ